MRELEKVDARNTSAAENELRRQISASVAWLDKRRRTLTRLDSTQFFIQVGGGGLTTVFLGLDFDNSHPALKNIALVLSALTAATTSFRAYRRYREIYIAYTDAASRLQGLLSRLSFTKSLSADGALSETALVELHQSFQDVHNSLNQNWRSLSNAAADKRA